MCALQLAESTLLLFLLLLAACFPASVTSPRSAAADRWPRCDECEAVAASIATVLDRQRLPKRKGARLRELGDSVLEELFEDEICVPERYAGYALARTTEDTQKVERLQGPGISWSEGLGPPPSDALLTQLSRRINQRLATRCQDVTDDVGPAKLYGMFRYVAERGEEHEAQLCPPGSGGGIIVRPVFSCRTPVLCARFHTASEYALLTICTVACRAHHTATQMAATVR